MGFIYERVASELEDAIANGVYPAGARLPSIRDVRDRFSVSASTAMEAYALLEEKGLIQPKPKSGHFVRPRPLLKDQPAKTWPSAEPEAVTVTDHTIKICWAPTKNDVHGLAVTAPLPTAIHDLSRSTARVARLHATEATKYQRPEGAQPLREAIARIMVEKACMVSPGDVFVTNGAHEALVLALRSTTSPNDVVAVESPTYFGVLQAIEALGLSALALPTDPRLGVDLNALEQVARDRAVKACVLAPTYQNPLGFCMSEKAKRAAVDILSRNGVPLIEDDVYSFMSLDAPGPRPAKSFDHLGNVIFCGSFSKTLSPSLRVGWALPGRYAKRFLREKWVANLSSAMVPQLAVADFLKGNRFRRLMQNTARQYARRLLLMREHVLKNFPKGTKCTAPAGGMVLWIELPISYDAMDVLGCARQHGITFLPGNIFAASNAFENFLRVSVSNVKEEEIPKIAHRLGEIVQLCGRHVESA